MIERIVKYSLNNKLIVLLAVLLILGFGIFSLSQLPIGAVPDITNNQVQVITVSRNLATEEVEKFITYPVELEMANLPGVMEIRSISKFGLSVVTIVFEDKMGSYLPRQLIAEKIKSAEEKIPKGFGTPFMGPVTTGLGEIYQYTIEVEPGYEDKYSLTDIRTIQDWIIKRQLSGVPGVVEINTWGGFLKQFDVAVNPEKLRALNISLQEVYDALKKNNSVSGGGYIEKADQAYFIRGEGLVDNMEDIRNIVIIEREGIPVYIRDVATVEPGHATRFGAITANGKGETVLGQVMMLKGANPQKTINAVTKRVAEIQKNLPEGITITPVVDRSVLIKKTTFTIAENLIFGFLIVIFVVVLLLGSFRSGMVVASVIPLSLLFAISMMYLFGIDANLMSLGAIDFGIIIDGAVIIVEFIAFKMSKQLHTIKGLKNEEKQAVIDRITFKSSTNMMRSAIFGQLIIIIVFIPIMSLSGVEGKMFIPMALVFSFALIGTMIMGFTYVPVVSSLVLRPENPEKRNITNRLLSFLQKAYKPSINWALDHRGFVIVASIVLLIGSGIIFSRMGGEFVPTLDEGDLVIQPVLKTGTSLTKTIEIITEMEKILKGFPEVEKVVTRIGAAEVPTDPMSMEESDVIVVLKPKKEWVTADTKEDLSNAFKDALSVLPGIEYEFTQPIEMRFNELITGVRADLAIKIFGSNLDILYQKASEISEAIQDVEGAADITVEKIVGLPQMSVRYNRAKIAKYGLNIDELNNIITTGFAGSTAGSIFDEEKRFDLVLKFDNAHRNSLSDLKRASIPMGNGQHMPLSEFAEIELSKGPAKISRDNTKRRVVVGVNVRNRDLESVVKDVRAIIDEKIKLPVGYSISYGGQFENLRSARKRLMVAVPVALFLILALLHFAFGSLREALMIYSAIPLAAVGGILLLFFRGMPFSISAGVGFIALFGIAVLNGIVLIEHFKELREQGIKDMKKRVITGASERLRPVLLTAGAAAMGFLPMAVSVSAGAEVQRPLATVVIGGLISSTLLTLIVLPTLYSIFEKDKPKRKSRFSATLLVMIGMMLIPLQTKAQKDTLTIEKAINIAFENNLDVMIGQKEVDQKAVMKKTAFDIEKTELYYNYDENNVAANGYPLRVWGVSQTFRFPTAYAIRAKWLNDDIKTAEAKLSMKKFELAKQVYFAYYNLLYLKQIKKTYNLLDSLYLKYALLADKKYNVGESSYLEKLNAESKQKEVHIKFQQQEDEILQARLNLFFLLQTDSSFLIPDKSLYRLALEPADTANHPVLSYYETLERHAKMKIKVDRQEMMPDINAEFFQGSNIQEDAELYNGFQLGVAIPLWFVNDQNRLHASKIEADIIGIQKKSIRIQLKNRYEQLIAELNKREKNLEYYEETGKDLFGKLMKHAEASYQNGEIDFLQYTLLLDNALRIELEYLENLMLYNKTIIELRFL